MAKIALKDKNTLQPQTDDGTRYAAVTENGQRIYAGPGVPLFEALRHAEGMLAPARVVRVESDNTLTPGTTINVDGQLSFVPAD